MSLYNDINTIKDLVYYIRKDFRSVNASKKIRDMLPTLLFQPGFKYVFWMRITRYFWLKKDVLSKIAYIISGFVLKHFSYKYQFDISYRAKIGAGLIIGHHGYIVIGGAAIIGENCFVRPGVVIGKKGGMTGEMPVIGDNVNIGTGAKIIGKITIGNNVIVGANSVVTHDVADNSVVGGIPARFIRYCESMWDC